MLVPDPFETLSRLQQALDTFQESDWLESSPSGTGPYPPVNIFRKGDDFVIVTELPGVKKSELDIQVKDNAIRIAGVKAVDYTEKASLHRRERAAERRPWNDDAHRAFHRLRAPAVAEQQSDLGSGRSGPGERRVGVAREFGSALRRLRVTAVEEPLGRDGRQHRTHDLVPGGDHAVGRQRVGEHPLHGDRVHRDRRPTEPARQSRRSGHFQSAAATRWCDGNLAVRHRRFRVERETGRFRR